MVCPATQYAFPVAAAVSGVTESAPLCRSGSCWCTAANIVSVTRRKAGLVAATELRGSNNASARPSASQRRAVPTITSLAERSTNDQTNDERDDEWWPGHDRLARHL